MVGNPFSFFLGGGGGLGDYAPHLGDPYGAALAAHHHHSASVSHSAAVTALHYNQLAALRTPGSGGGHHRSSSGATSLGLEQDSHGLVNIYFFY